MTQPLFLTPEEYVSEKTAAETRLPEDPNQWPTAILQELYKQVPYISDFQPHVNMSKVDAEQGYGFGHVEISNQTEAQASATPEAEAAAGIQKIRIPIIIKDNKLSPLDLMLTPDSKTLPLTEERLRSTIFRPQAFDVTGTSPGDQSLVGQLYPPFRDSAVLGGSGVTAPGSQKEAGISGLEDYLSTGVEKEEKLVQGLGTNNLSVEHLPKEDRVVVKSIEQGGGKEAPATESGAGATRDNKSEKTASAFEDYYKNPQRHGRLGKKEQSGELTRTGLLDEFIAKHASSGLSLLESVAPSITEGDMSSFIEFCTDVRIGLTKNASAMLSAVETICAEEPVSSEKMASAVDGLITPTVLQLVRKDEGYELKTASYLAWQPKVVQLNRGEAIKAVGEKVVLAADLEGAATQAETPMAEPPPTQGDEDTAGAIPVEEMGTYKVWDDSGAELIGIVATNLVDIDGKAMPISLFTNGSQVAVQTDIVGVPVQGGAALPTADTPQGSGVFFGPGMDGDQVTIPLTIKASIANPQSATVFDAETFDGRPVAVSIHEGAQAVVGDGATMMIPGHWSWSPLGDAESVSLASAEPQESPEEAEGSMPGPAPEAGGPGAVEASGGAEVGVSPEAKVASAAYGHVTVRSSGPGSFTFSGSPVEKLASSERNDVSLDGAMFLLAGLGTHMGYGVAKLAQALTGYRPERIKIAQAITTMSERRSEATKLASISVSKVTDLKVNLWKEAAQMSDPAAIDTILSLGFLNSENITTFIGYLPTIDETQQKLCELLLAARLGQTELPESALERSVRSIEEAITGLKSLAFQGL